MNVPHKTNNIPSPDPRYGEAVACFGRGMFAEALTLAEALLREHPQHLEALNLAAAAALSLGQLDTAEARWRQALALDPNYAAGYSNLALLQQSRKQYDQAEATYRQALAIKPDFTDARYNLGLLYQEQGRVDEAMAAYQQVLAQQPGYAKASQNLGFLHQGRQQWAEAEACFRQAESALGQGGSSTEGHYKNLNNLGLALQSQKKFAEAARAYRQALAIHPGYTLAANNLGLALHELGQREAAEAAYRQALQFDPKYPEAWNNLANLIRLDGRFAEAEAAYRQAMAYKENYAEAMSNLGLMLVDLKRYAEAEALYRRSLALNPQGADARLNFGLLLLLQGQYEAGWPYYEARYDTGRRNALSTPKLPFPQWQGEDLRGKSILIWPEQGLGDELQMVRYVSLLRQRGAARITLLCKQPLKRLFDASAGADAVVVHSRTQGVTAHDYWDFPLSLPLHCQTWVDALPAQLPYLAPPAGLLAQWQPRLPTGGFKVGLVWKGNPGHKNDARRSLAGLAELAPLWQVPGVSFISLQKGQGEDEAANPPPGQPLLNLGPAVTDFADTAAILAQLDLVICVDTSIAHLAGALGKPCWVMVPAVNTDWRWGATGEASPWYPGVMRLFRLPEVDAPWSQVVARIAVALAARVAGKKEKKPKLPKPVKDKESAEQANTRAVALQQAGRYDEAEAAYHKARRLQPQEARYAFNLGTLYQATGRLLPAEIAHRDAMRLDPDIPESAYNLGLVLLAQGRYGEAWPAYEGRYDTRRRVPVTLLPQLPFPLWQGESLQGKSILVWLEQGFGDEIQFVRYLPRLKGMGASRVVLLCKPPLAALFQASGIADEVIPASGELKLPPVDYWAPLLNLPRWCGTRHIDDIPGQLPYLRAPAARIEAWSPRLPEGEFRVGLVWKGHSGNRNDAYRSLPHLAALAPLWQVPGVSFVSLQKGQGEDEAANPPPGQPLVPLGQAIEDFADSAAIIAQLDLVIAVDTAVAHLAGALGKPCWVLIPARGTDWRWLRDREDSPWYPGVMRLFRLQDQDDPWPEAVARLAAALAAQKALGKPAAAVAVTDYSPMTQLMGQGRFADALNLLEPLLLAPSPAVDTLNLAAVCAAASGQRSRASQWWRQAVALDPSCHPAWRNLAALLQRDGLLDEAETPWRRYLALCPEDGAAWSALGLLCHAQGQLAAAEPCLRRATELQAQASAPLMDLGVCLYNQGRVAEAEAAYRQSLAIDPDNQDTRFNLGMLLLARGAYGEGWACYEARHHPGRAAPNPVPQLGYPQWRGEPLAGKSIIVFAEQGYGDEIQFVRYLPLLKARGAARVTLVCSAPLDELFQQVAGADGVTTVENGQVVNFPPHDYWCLSLSLPLGCGTTLETIPAQLPYLAPDPARVAHWQPALPAGGFKVGLVWKGRPSHTNDHWRSLAHLAQLAPLWQVPGVSFVSLQKGEGEGEPAQVAPSQPLTTLAGIKDFSDTAAILGQLDLVICVDTAIAHLAGALGKPCWVLLADAGLDWRWLLEREDSPWYPGVIRLFRQAPDAPTWEALMPRVVAALAEVAQAHSPASATRPPRIGTLSQNKALFQQAVLLEQRGQFAEAETLLRQAIAEAPPFPRGQQKLAQVLERQGRHPEAEAAYRAALAADPQYAVAWNNLGILLQQQQRLDEAETAYTRALAAKPDYPRAAYNLGTLYQSQNHPAAEATLQRAVSLDPGYARAHYALGNLYLSQQRLAEAESAYRATVAADPSLVPAWTALAQVLRQSQRLDDAIQVMEQALALRPDLGPQWLTLGVLFKDSGRWDDAENAYRRALALDPDEPSVHMNLGMLLLTRGRYTEGWPHFEARYHPRRPKAIPVPVMPFPQWQGESLQGKSIIVWPEQGFGDKFQFVRHLPRLKAMGASRVTLVCSPTLGPVFAQLPGADQVLVVEDGQRVPVDQHDYWTLILSLPLHCGTTLENLPATLPYLHPDPARVAQWQPRLPRDGLKVGLVWRGRPSHGNDARRSLTGLAQLAPLWQVPGIHFISLQKGEGEDEAAHPPANQPLLAFADEIKDFADTAALISQLDLLICVDTAVAHLAGALGKPCWVMLPSAGLDWRWLLDRDDSPWYPGVMRLFRQNGPDAPWSEVIQRVADALATYGPEAAPVLDPGPCLNQALAHWQAGETAAALDQARQGLRLSRPGQSAHLALLNLAGAAALRLGQPQTALPWLQQALALAPENADIHYNLGLAYQDLGDLPAAASAYQQALARQAIHPSAQHNLGRVYQAQGQTRQAEAAYCRTLDLKPDHAEAWHNLGLLRQDAQRFDDAESALAQAVTLAPQDPDYRLSLALRRLARGAYAQAWPDYELRYRPDRRQAPAQPLVPFPRWRGEPLAGKSLLIWPEQGMGDEIQFVRYLPLLKARGAGPITLMCKPPLLALLQGVAGADAVVPYAEGSQLPTHDYWVFPLSLPGLCGTTLDTVPARLPYLQADPARIKRWAPCLPRPGRKVGLVWRGNPEHPRDAQRSLPSLQTLAPLGTLAGINLISLQKGVGEAEAMQPPAPLSLTPLGAEMADFADAAALISQLDLLITVDTAMAHLAGALGKPCWIILGEQGLDWRWQDVGDHSPWYPGVVRLFRQSPGEGWDALIQRLLKALKAWSATEPQAPAPAVSFADALAAYEGGQLPRALDLARQGLVADPDSLNFLNLAAGAAMALNRREEAEPWLRRAISRYPQVSALHANLGVLLHEMGRLAEAEPCCRRAVAMNPEDSGVRSNLGSLLQDLGQFQEAEDQYRQALAMDPNNPLAHNNLGSLLRRLQRFDEAETAYRQARRLAPESAESAYNLGYLYLAQGRFAEGWPLYESRAHKRQANTFPPPVAYPQWQGQDLKGKSILVWPEQGFGDELQFVRYLGLLRARGAARITLACKQPLLALFSESKDLLGADEVIQDNGRGSGLARYTHHDYWAYLLSLPLGLGTDLSNIPAPVPYLQATPVRQAAWASRLPAGGLKVGLVWRGNPRHQNDSQRSLQHLAQLAPLWQVPGIHFISLQKGAGEDEARLAPADQPLTHLGSGIRDFADTAALVSQLDLVICVDTAMAHLAGALGKPVWVLLPWVGNDWRWLPGRDDSPWYPTMRLFRQDSADTPWSQVIARIQQALSQFSPPVPPVGKEKKMKQKASKKSPAASTKVSTSSPQKAQPVVSQEAQAHRQQREKSLALYRAGDLVAAVQNQIALINQPPISEDDRADDFNLLGGIFHALGDHAASVMAMGECAKRRPTDAQAQENLAVALKFAGRVAEAVTQFEHTIAMGRTTPNLLDGLASALATLGRLDESRQRGRQSLGLKDQEYCAANTHPPLVLPPRKVFDPSQPERNIIAFSLWGDKPRYIHSAIENVRAARYVYPSWRCRFYCDTSVPVEVLAQLKAEGAQVHMMAGNKLYEGLFWRFQVINDPTVDFFLVRDADAVVNTRERVAVDEWLASDKHFHVMRDWYTHTELILAGMWGGVAGALPDLNAMLAQYRSTSLETRTLDQQFLRSRIWPLIRNSLMAHDSLFDFMDSRPFPAVGQLPPGCHVGQSVIPY